MLLQLASWQSILDILFFAIGVFFLYRTLISLGTWKIVYGILIATLFFIVSSQIGLKGIEWIYRNVSHIAVLSLVILFQPEIRKIFERAASLRRAKEIRPDEQIVGIISESAWILAEQGVGALIVIPGRESIDPWTKGGYPLNGKPSKPLLLSIFDPNSPGHDGALILEDNVLTNFGVRLPVSQSGRLSEEYGTRHQSAMGLCEQTDALVVVASEERRRVSVFRKGSMMIMKQQKDIADQILSHYRNTGFFDRLKTGNLSKRTLWIEMAASVLIAAALWLTIIPGQVEILEKVITVPIEYTATSDDVVLTGEKAKEARLHLSGSKSDLNAIPPGAMSVKVNLEKAAAGQQTVLISDDNIRLPKGVKLLDVDPSSLQINIAKLMKTKLLIKPQLVGTLPKNYSIQSIVVKPELIEVFIPSGKAGEATKNITTTPIYLEGIQQSTTIFCKIIVSPFIQPIEKRWPDVEVTLVVRPKPNS